MNVDKLELIKKGFVDAEVPASLDLKSEIKKLQREKKAVILAHYYQEPDIQDIADYVGDSLALSQAAAETNADIIVFAGVHFMAETAKILAPNKKVLLPDLNAGCSLADSCKAEDFEAFIKANPGHVVISYVNTTAEVKALTDVVVTSSNAVQIVESFPADQKIIFGPDRNLGNYIKGLTNRENMLIWDGACHVHDRFSLERIIELKKQYPTAKLIAHPECPKPVLLIADHIGSTSSLLEFTKKDTSTKYIVATEPGVIHQMRKFNPQKEYIPAPPNDSTCACNDCMFMKMITLKKIYNTLKYEVPEINMDETLRRKAEGSIRNMLDLSKKLGLIK